MCCVEKRLAAQCSYKGQVVSLSIGCSVGWLVLDPSKKWPLEYQRLIKTYQTLPTHLPTYLCDSRIISDSSDITDTFVKKKSPPTKKYILRKNVQKKIYTYIYLINNLFDIKCYQICSFLLPPIMTKSNSNYDKILKKI